MTNLISLLIKSRPDWCLHSDVVPDLFEAPGISNDHHVVYVTVPASFPTISGCFELLLRVPCVPEKRGGAGTENIGRRVGNGSWRLTDLSRAGFYGRSEEVAIIQGGQKSIFGTL